MEISQHTAEQSPEREGLGLGDMYQLPNLSLPEAKPSVGLSLQVSQFGGSVCCYRYHKIRGVHGSFPFFWHKHTKILLNKQIVLFRLSPSQSASGLESSLIMVENIFSLWMKMCLICHVIKKIF